MTEEQVGMLDRALNLNGRITRDDWIKQARDLAAA